MLPARRRFSRQLSAAEYKAQNAVLVAKIVQARQLRDAHLAVSEATVGIDEILDKVFSTKTLTQELSDLLIEKVSVHPNGDTEIASKSPVFRDIVEETKKPRNSRHKKYVARAKTVLVRA